jgi:hypothetical protein
MPVALVVVDRRSVALRTTQQESDTYAAQDEHLDWETERQVETRRRCSLNDALTNQLFVWGMMNFDVKRIGAAVDASVALL